MGEGMVRGPLYLGHRICKAEPIRLQSLSYAFTMIAWLTESIFQSSDGEAQVRSHGLLATFSTITESL